MRRRRAGNGDDRGAHALSGSAARRWAGALAGWAIPPAILDQAPESPWGFPPSLFAPDAPTVASVSRARALDALDALAGGGGTVLDVGAGGGAASLVLVPPATRVVAVDESDGMLAAFAEHAARVDVAFEVVAGRWPDVAVSVAAADVVVCHHVFYNVADLPAFAGALTDHARARVVVELTDGHPQSATAPLWRHFWDLDRPDGPTAADAVAVLAELGLDVSVAAWTRPPRHARPGVSRADVVAFMRRRLCLPAARDAEVDALLGDDPVLSPRGVVTLWWDGTAAA